MVSFPPCKINLGLQIISKRNDGYHNLNTCFYPIPWTDILELIPSSDTDMTISGLDIPGDLHTNLCLKAYHLLNKDFALPPVKIHLHKVLPTGAGLGGGSSDAAHTLRLLNTTFELNLSNEQLFEYAAKLGSDCAFFIQDKPMTGSGRGEVLNDIALDLHGKYLVLVKPDIHVSTVEAYAGVIPRLPSLSISDILVKPIVDWKDYLLNDFENSVFRKYPEIEKIKKDLYEHGAVYASMSGSGASVFGIFENEVDFKTNYTSRWCGFL